MGRNTPLVRDARHSLNERILFAAILATVACIGVAVWVVVEPPTRVLVQATGNVLAGFAVAVLTWQTARVQTERRLQLSWLLLSAGLAVSALADAGVAVLVLISGGEYPAPLVSNLGHLLMVPLAFAGVLLRPSLEPRSVARRVLLIDTWLAMSALVAVAWTLVLAPLFDALGTDPLTGAVAVANPLGHLGLVCCLLIALLRQADTRKATVPLLLGLSVMVAGDAGRGALMLHGSYAPGHPIDVFWFLALGVISMAAMEERAHPQPAPRPVGMGRVRAPWRFIPSLVLLSLTTAVVWLASIQRGSIQVSVGEMALAAGWLLLLARVYVGFRTKRDEHQHERQLRVGHAQSFRRELHRRQQLEVVHGLSADLTRELDLDTLLPLIAERAAGLLSAPSGVVLLWDAAARVLTPRAWYGLGTRYGALRISPGDGVVGRVVQQRRGVLVNDQQSAREALLPLLTSTNVTAALATPMVASGRLVGVLVVADDRPGHAFSGADLQLLDMYTRQAAVAVDHARLVDEAASLEASREVMRLKTELLSTVSHELRTPLTLIHGYAELLSVRAAALRPEDVTMMAGEILVGSRTMIRLVDDLLDFSRMSSSGLTLALDPVDIGQMVREQVETWPDPAERSRLLLDLDAGPLLAVADRARVGQIVRHLLANALGHAPDGPVAVRVRPEDGWIRLEVADQGPGIPTEELPRIWESFFRGERARNSPNRGSGLGLAVVRQLVDLHGGRADVVSAEGNGAAFRIWLPTAPPARLATDGLPPA